MEGKRGAEDFDIGNGFRVKWRVESGEMGGRRNEKSRRKADDGCIWSTMAPSVVALALCRASPDTAAE